MRPKKVILSMCDSEFDLSVRTFLLETSGYRVLAVTNHEDAVKIFVENGVDLVLIDQTTRAPISKMIDDLKTIRQYVPILLLTEVERTQHQVILCDAMLWSSKTSNQELLERIRVLSARKRGPKKGRVYGAHQPQLETVPA